MEHGRQIVNQISAVTCFVDFVGTRKTQDRELKTRRFESKRRTVVKRKNGQKVTLKIAGSTVDYRDCFRLPSMPGRVRKVELDHPNRTHKSDAVLFKQGRLNLLFSFGVSRLYDTVPRYVQYSERCIILPAIRSYGRAYAGVETSLLASWSFDPRSITKLEIISVESCLPFVFRSSRSCISVSCFSLSNRPHVRLLRSSLVLRFFNRNSSHASPSDEFKRKYERNETNWKYYLSKSCSYQRKRL